jgi:hypothetical protein
MHRCVLQPVQASPCEPCHLEQNLLPGMALEVQEALPLLATQQTKHLTFHLPGMSTDLQLHGMLLQDFIAAC